MRVSELLNIAKAEIGTKESPAYSNMQKYGAAYGMNGVPWCVLFLSWLFDRVNALPALCGGKVAYKCSQVEDYAISLKRWIIDGDYKVGDVVIFDFDNDKINDHIGIISEVVAKGTYKCIEGNTSPDNKGSQSNGGMVCERTRYNSQIKGVYRPLYESENRNPYKVPTTEVRKGHTGNSVRWVQWELNESGAKLVVDGDFGPKTDKAVKDFQKKYKLNIKRKGVVGKITRQKLIDVSK